MHSPVAQAPCRVLVSALPAWLAAEVQASLPALALLYPLLHLVAAEAAVVVQAVQQGASPD